MTSHLNLSTVLLLGLAVSFSACDFNLEADDIGCDTQLVAKVEALSAAATKLDAAATGMRDKITDACTQIALSLGKEVPATGGEITDQDLVDACDEAKAGIEEVFKDVTIGVEGGQCFVDAQAQFACESSCMVDVSCDPGSVVTRCDPGHLSGICSGACVGGAVCQGTAEMHAQCSGSCGGTCVGTCDGSDSDGYCAGRCEGTCSGSCRLAADAEINCGVDVACKGGCTVDYQAPRCETQLDPPDCQIDTDCEAACRAQASFQADCVPPTVTIYGAETIDQEAVAALVENLPALINGALIQGALMVEAGIEVSQTYPPAAKAVAGLPQCLLFFAEDLVASADASVTAATTLSGSVQASVSITATVGVSTY